MEGYEPIMSFGADTAETMSLCDADETPWRQDRRTSVTRQWAVVICRMRNQAMAKLHADVVDVIPAS